MKLAKTVGLRRRALTLTSLFCVTATAGCMKQYVPPTADQPHAIVKYRRTYEEQAGSQLHEAFIIDKQLGFSNDTTPELAETPLTDAILVHPAPAALKLKSIFSHMETRTRQESYSCGSYDNPRTCYRTVSRQEAVTDGACVQELGVRFESGKNYLIQLNYQDRRNCSVHCFEQKPTGDGEFQNSPCKTYAVDD